MMILLRRVENEPQRQTSTGLLFRALAKSKEKRKGRKDGKVETREYISKSNAI